MEKATYLSTAETDYKAFLLLVENGHNNTAAFLAAQACEKYAKHILCVVRGEEPKPRADMMYYNVTSKQMAKVGHFIPLPVSLAYKESGRSVTMAPELRDAVAKLSYLYYNSRYPNAAAYHEVSKEEIDECAATVQSVRSWCYEKLSQLEISAALSDKRSQFEEDEYDEYD